MDGVFLIDKEAGVTSHDIVYRVRRELGKGVKVGHAGTLDPFATGLLLVLAGKGTRVQRWLMGLPKSYETTAHLGYTSTTGDVDGEIAPGRAPSLEHLPTGVLRQRPPAYSAVKVDGKRAYALARAGQVVELAEREVNVSRFDLLHREGDRATFAIDCSSGTYVRSLIADLGDAYCETLRRTAIGPFRVQDAGTTLTVNEALAFLPQIELSGADAKKAGHGVRVPGEAEGTVRLVDEDGLIALAEPREDGLLKPVVGFRG